MPTKRPIVILSHDAGTLNYGWCVNYYHNGGMKTLAVGKMTHRVAAIHENLNESVAAYKEEVAGIVREYGVTHQAFERFQARNAGLYNIIECVNLMMGALIGTWGDTMRFDGFYASVWKNSVNRRLDAEFGYKLDVSGAAKLPPLPRKDDKKVSASKRQEILEERQRLMAQNAQLPSGYRKLFAGVSDHMVDAFFINVCGWYRQAGIKPFQDWDAQRFQQAGAEVRKAAGLR